jgi:hypothetical protein
MFNSAPGGAQLGLSGITKNASSNMTIIRNAKGHYPLAAGGDRGVAAHQVLECMEVNTVVTD